jgi:murein tripeptide amidase MpaA
MMNDTTRTYPRTLRQAFGMSPEDAQAIYVYRKPLAERVVIWLLFRWGWALLLVLVFALTGCTGPSDYETDVIVAQDLQDAVMQARGER